MKALCSEVLPLLEAKHSLVLVTLTEQSGSAPRSAGARMLVLADGSILGTIGGGRYEAEAIEAALVLHRMGAGASGAPLGTRPGILLAYSLHGVEDMDMICGGALTLLLEYLPAGHAPVRKAFAQGQEAEAAGRAFSFAVKITVTDSRCKEAARSKAGFPLPGQSLCVDVERFAICPADQAGKAFSLFLPGDLPQDIAQQAARLYEARPPLPPPLALHRVKEEGSCWLLEHFAGPARVFLFGGGHVSFASARLAQSVGFRVVVIDDRPEFASPERFPGASIERPPSLSEEDMMQVLSRMRVSPEDALVILTRGHAHDREALAAALSTSAGYIGMIGSKSKRDAVYAQLTACGLAPERLGRVHAPIGLAIGAESPEEIAVSIVGELILWRSGLQRPEGL